MDIKPIVPEKKKKFYVDNVNFIRLLDEYKKTRVFSDELGELFYLIAKNLSYSRQFINYSESWKNEMISDALYNFCRYAGTFNSEKSQNPFAYFTTVAINAFIMRIKKEKFRNLQDSSVREELYSEFLNDYKLNTGIDIHNTEDSVYMDLAGSDNNE